MVVGLLALSLAMIVGGVFAAVLGWDIVLLERGWTMVIAGSICAGSGAVLLGIAAVVGRLSGVRSELASLHDEMTRLGAPVPPPPEMDPAAAVSSALLAGGAASGSAQASSASAAEDGEGSPSTLPPFMRPAEAGETLRASERDEDTVPFREEPARAPEWEGSVGAGHGDVPARSESEAGAGFSSPDRRPGGDRALPRFEPEDQADRVPSAAEDAELVPSAQPVRRPEPVVEPEPEPSREPDETAPSEPAPTVIGTYNSGDNRYVMFSDGSIEAETPEGVFRFNSLDELKEFIAAGGEGGPATS
jgi:hypothetical protein